MKRFVRWLAKVFKAEITVEKVKEVIVYRDRIKHLVPDSKLTGCVSVDGDICVDGSLNVTGEVTCFKTKEGGEA